MVFCSVFVVNTVVPSARTDTATTVLYIRLLVTIDRTSTGLSKSVEIYAHGSTRKRGKGSSEPHFFGFFAVPSIDSELMS